ncbi:MAG: hypothetical protein AAGA48_04275 [Myxococcota bacterium]
MDVKLYTRITEQPADLDRWAVLFDWLAEHDDPRVHFARDMMNAALAPLVPHSLAALQLRGLSLPGPRVLGPIMSDAHHTLALWRLGYLHTVQLDAMHAGVIETSLRKLLAHPSGSLLERLSLRPAPEMSAGLEALTEVPMAGLRELFVGPYNERAVTSTSVDLEPLWDHVSRLVVLTVRGHRMRLGEVRAPYLERLVLQGPFEGWPYFPEEGCPRLRELVVDLGVASEAMHSWSDAWLPFERVTLTSLTLENAYGAHGLVGALSMTANVQSLRKLVLPQSDLADVDVLLGHLAAFENLEVLKLGVPHPHLDVSSLVEGASKLGIQVHSQR